VFPTISGPLADVIVDAILGVVGAILGVVDAFVVGAVLGVVVLVDAFDVVGAVLGVVVFLVVLDVLCSSWDEGGVLTSCVCSLVCLLSLEVVGTGGEGACAVVVVGVVGVTSGDVTVGIVVDNRFFFGLPVQ